MKPIQESLLASWKAFGQDCSNQCIRKVCPYRWARQVLIPGA